MDELLSVHLFPSEHFIIHQITLKHCFANHIESIEYESTEYIDKEVGDQPDHQIVVQIIDISFAVYHDTIKHNKCEQVDIHSHIIQQILLYHIEISHHIFMSEL